MQTANEGRKYKIDISDWRNEVTINWGAYGSVTIEEAMDFRRALNDAIATATRRQDAIRIEASKA